MNATRGTVATGSRLIGKRVLLRCPRSRKLMRPKSFRF